MREKFLPFSVPFIEEDDVQGVVDVLRSGWITTGPKSYEFEKKLAEYVGSPFSCALTSATAGMHLVLKAFDIKAGDEVITSSMTWVSTVNLIVLSGARPVFADIDKQTLMITPETISKVITDKTRLIVPVHFAGATCDMDEIRMIAKKKNIRIVEDAAHALGSEYKGKRVGSSGTSIFSFHPIKNITTAEGGMVCSDEKEVIEKVRRLKFHGLDKDAWHKYKKNETATVEVIEPGYKYNMPDMLASLGLTQLSKLDKLNSKRGELSRLYDKLLLDVEEVRPIGKPVYSYKDSYHLYIVILDTDKLKIKKEAFLEELKNRQIGTGVHFHAAHLHHYYRENMGCKRGMLPHTERVSDRLFSLPLFPQMTQEDVQDVVMAIKDIISKSRTK